MSDFDDLRTAVEDAARATVVPPFGAVERRARARRHRQVAGVAAGLVAVLAAGAVAVPDGGNRSMEPAAPAPTASPAHTGCPEPDGGVAVDGQPPLNEYCMDGGEDADTARCWTEGAPKPGEPGATTLGSGTAGRTRWWVVRWTGKEGTRCVGWFSDPAVDMSWQMDRDNDTGPDGALRPVLSQDGLPVRGAEDWEWMVYWGAVPPEVVRIDFMDGARKVGTLVPVDGGDRKYVAGVVRAPDERHGVPVAYDAEGRRVALPERS